MPTRSSALSLLLLSTDPDLQEQFKQEFKQNLTVLKDLDSLPRMPSRRGFDGVILETRRGGPELADVQQLVDPLHTFIVAGTRSVLSHAAGFVHTMGAGRMNGNGAASHLEGFLESKLGEFVKGMKSSSARNLHPMLISAIERPLIAHALKETNGNQIQAAHLLGMNRNTLRKKITDLRIPVKRERGRRSRQIKGD